MSGAITVPDGSPDEIDAAATTLGHIAEEARTAAGEITQQQGHVPSVWDDIAARRFGHGLGHVVDSLHDGAEKLAGAAAAARGFAGVLREVQATMQSLAAEYDQIDSQLQRAMQHAMNAPIGHDPAWTSQASWR